MRCRPKSVDRTHRIESTARLSLIARSGRRSANCAFHGSLVGRTAFRFASAALVHVAFCCFRPADVTGLHQRIGQAEKRNAVAKLGRVARAARRTADCPVRRQGVTGTRTCDAVTPLLCVARSDRLATHLTRRSELIFRALLTHAVANFSQIARAGCVAAH